MFTWKSHAGLKFHFGQNERCEIICGLWWNPYRFDFISPQFMWTQVKSWLNTEVRFSTGMKSHNGLSSFRLSCERTVRILLKIQEFQTQKFLQNCYCLDLLKACEIFLILTQLYLTLLLKRIFIWYLLFWLTCIRRITNLFCLT